MKRISKWIGLAAWIAAAAPVAAQPPAPQTNLEAATDLEAATVQGRRLIPLTAEEHQALQEADIGYPHLSIEDAARMLCAAERISSRPRSRPPRGRASFGSYIGGFEERARARDIYRQTLEFEETKLAYREGRASLEQFVEAERARQYALRRIGLSIIQVEAETLDGALAEDPDAPVQMAEAQPPGTEVLVEGENIDADLQFNRWGSLEVETLDWRMAPAPTQRTLLVKVRLTNHGRGKATVPSMTLLALDRGSRLVGSLGKETRPRLELQPGQSIVVEIPYEEVPIYAHTVVARFGEGPARDIRPCNHLDAVRAPGGDLAALTPGRVSAAAEVGPPQRVMVELRGARWVEEGGRRRFQITGSAVNLAPIALRMPPLAVVIYDGADVAVGGATLPTSRAVIGSGEAQDFTVRIDGVEALPAANGADPMSLMRRVALVME